MSSNGWSKSSHISFVWFITGACAKDQSKRLPQIILVYQLVNPQKSCEGCFYICRTCDSEVMNDKVPCRVVFHYNSRSAETVLMAGRILFQKVTIKPKGQLQKVKVRISKDSSHLIKSFIFRNLGLRIKTDCTFCDK